MRRTALLATAATALALAAPAPALGAFGFSEVGLSLTGTQAGAHPGEVTTTVQMNTILNEAEDLELPDGQLRNLEVDMPAGFAGNPTAVPSCSDSQFLEVSEGVPACPNSSAVGFAAVKAEFDAIEPGAAAYYHVPLYSLEADPGYAAKLGFTVLGVPVSLDVGVREAPPYNVYAKLADNSQAALFYGSKVTLWGVPAASVHDPYRGSCLNALVPGSIDEIASKGKCVSGIPPAPFLTAPRSCEGPLTASFLGTAWNTGLSATATASAPARSGCAALGFAPEAQAHLTNTAAESPAGLEFDLNVEDPGLADPSEEATALSDIKSTEVTLPAGVTLNPAQAEGLAACSQADLARESASSPFGAGCPAASKVGSVEVETPLLEDQVLKGSLFLATPHQNPFNSLLALYMVVKDPELGIAVKLPARVAIDGQTGQLTTTFGDPSAADPALRTLPQLPLGHVHVVLSAGARSPLVTPPACGSYEGKAVFTPWADPANTATSPLSFQVTSGPGGGPCPTATAPFGPAFEAGTLANAAGSFSPLLMRLTRTDGEQELTRLSATLPQGLVPKLAGVAQCPDGAIAAAKHRSGAEELLAPSCPAQSLVGHLTSGAGVGSALSFVHGSLYLAGPFAGHPLSVAAIVPAVAGPFDLGTVVVREALDLNPTSYLGEIDGAASDPIPHILEGIPLRLRDLRIAVDRPEFTLNPTSCTEKQITATASGQSSQAPLAARYQAADCAALAFKPKLSLKLSGQMGHAGNPALRSVLIPRTGDANIAGATVLLPKSEFIDQSHINNPCTRVQFAEGACPPKSILGTARARSPLLEAPLEGPVYFRSNGGERELPDLVADLHGQFHIILVGFIDSRHGRTRTRFQSVPDAPVSRFELKLFGGKRGLLENTRDLCQGKAPRVTLALAGQNGRRQVTKPRLGTSCGRKRRGHKR
jgi:hypothetical protein